MISCSLSYESLAPHPDKRQRLKGAAALRHHSLGSVSVWVFVPVSPVRVSTCGGRFPPPVPMNIMENSKKQELQTPGSRAWDNPAYSNPPSPNGTLRICTVSSVALPETQPKKPEVRRQEKTQRTLVSSCCLHICQSIRGTGHEERVFLGS